jgi:hypothetical protein
VNDLQADKKYYQANIALATSSLAAKTTALIAQVSIAGFICTYSFLTTNLISALPCSSLELVVVVSSAALMLTLLL